MHFLEAVWSPLDVFRLLREWSRLLVSNVIVRGEALITLFDVTGLNVTFFLQCSKVSLSC